MSETVFLREKGTSCFVEVAELPLLPPPMVIEDLREGPRAGKGRGSKLIDLPVTFSSNLTERAADLALLNAAEAVTSLS
jgi:hypothetical protein